MWCLSAVRGTRGRPKGTFLNPATHTGSLAARLKVCLAQAGPGRSKFCYKIGGMPRRRKLVSQSSLFETDNSTETAPALVERCFNDPRVLVGTSAFTASGWSGSFYPAGMKSSDYLTHYASKFRTVEIDSTYYGAPSESTVTSWHRRTPPDFIFAAKVPQVITHEKTLLNCEAEFDEFIGRMGLLGEKMGPLLFQFPHFDKYQFNGPDEFFLRLRGFLKRINEMSKCGFVVEIRNKTWLTPRLTDLLGEHNVALALTDTSFVARPWEMKEKFELVTADFAYVRWLGERKGIEKITTTWDQTVVDRKEDLRNWVTVIQQLVNDKRIRKLFAFANNHYGGHGPATIKQFWDLWTGK
jgi:uncharacterized protein YecE (DUF72 family)